jgi:hypothetical protein
VSRASCSARAAATPTRDAIPIASTATPRKAAFFPIESARTARSSDAATASGIPGKPPPLPRSRSAGIRRSMRIGHAVRLSTTWRTAIAAGSRIEVRLIAAFQARSSRT